MLASRSRYYNVGVPLADGNVIIQGRVPMGASSDLRAFHSNIFCCPWLNCNRIILNMYILA